MNHKFSRLAKTFAYSCAFLSFSAAAQTNLEQGRTAFLNNQRDVAQVQLTDALKNSEQKNEALLWLSFLSENLPSAGKPFNHFREFLKNESEHAPYLVALWSSPQISSGYSKKSPEELTFFKQLAENSNVEGSIKAMAYSAIGSHFEEVKQKVESDKAYSKIGSVDNWTITGEFENISASGFDKNYETLTRPQLDAVFSNRYGAKINWFSPSLIRKDKWFDFTNYLNPEDAVVFAQTFLNSPTEQEVQLRAGVSGSLKVWLNDQLIMAIPEERNNDLDSYLTKVKLHQGYNRILVQVGESYADRSNFLIRLTDSKGDLIPNLTSTQTPQQYSKETAYQAEQLKPFAEAYFEKLAKQDPENVLKQIMLAKVYLRSDKDFEARNTLDKLKKQYPKSTFINTLMIELFARSQNDTGLKSAQEDIKMYDPESALALTYIYNDYVKKEDYVRAEEYVKKLEKIYGADDRDILYKYILLAGYNKKQAELVKLADIAFSKYPDDERFVEYRYLIETEVKKNNKAATEVLKKYLQHNDNYSLATALASIYFKTSKVEEGLKVIQSEINYDPVASGIYSKMSDIYIQLQQYSKAEDYIKKAIAIEPYNSNYHFKLAGIYLEQGNKALAGKQYQTTLTLYPANYTAIKELRKLESKKDVYEYFPQHDIAEIVKNAPGAEKYPEDNALILTEDKQVIIYPSGASEERHIMLTKILNTTGLEKWKEYDAQVNNWQNYIIEDAEVIKANGSKVPAEVNENSIVFTNLEVGDCIYVRHKLYNYSKGRLAGKFWDTFYFTHGYPYLNSSYNVLLAKSQKLNFDFSQRAIEHTKTSVDDFDLYTWKGQNEESLKYEDKMPAFDDIANALHVSTIPDWTYVSKWYSDLASAKARPNYEVKEAVKLILADGKKYSDTEKAQVIYDYITKSITYSSVSFRQSGLVPQNPATVLNTRIGDCKDVSTLFLSMAKEAGIDAQLVLVNTKDNGMKSLILPSINFNHCMIKVNTDNKVRYLELTSNYLPFSSFGAGSLNSVILDIDDKDDDKKIKFLNPDTRKPNTIFRTTKVDVDNNDLVVSEKNYRVGALSAFSREDYINLSEKDKLKRMQESLQNWLPTAELSKLSFKNIENSGNRDTLFTNVDYKIKNEVKKIGGITIVTLPWSDKAIASDFSFSATPRIFPTDLSKLYGVDSETQELTFQIPADKVVIENVTPVKLSNEFLEYSLSVKTVGKTIAYSRTFKVKNPIVPAAKTDEFMAFYKQIIAADGKQLALK